MSLNFWVVLLLLVLSGAGSLVAQAPNAKPLDNIARLMRSDIEEVVSVIGFVDAERQVTSRTYKTYYLKDRFGQGILIRTSNPLPEILTRLTVTGVLLRDANTKELFITETGRVLQPEITKQPEVRTEVTTGTVQKDTEVIGEKAASALARMDRGDASQAMAEAQNKPQESSTTMLSRFAPWQLFLGGALLLTLAITGALVFGGRQRKVDTPPTFTFSDLASGAPSASIPPVPQDVEQFKTVRVYKTTRIIPVSLEVMNGDAVVERIPLYDQTGDGIVELGRDVPGVTQGVRIKDPSNTLSRNQARISVDRETNIVRITNLAPASSNGTMVNGRALKDGESVEVKNGDRVQMGSISTRLVVA